MKKPKRIIIVRHAESVHNAAGDVHMETPSYAYALSPKGEGQALDAGQSLKEMIGEESVMFITSDYLRAKLTLKGILQSFLEHKEAKVKINPLLRERERTGANKSWGQEVSTFYSEVKGGGQGETFAHVTDRTASFWTGLKTDMVLGELPDNVVIVSHDQTIRSLVSLIYGVGHQMFEKLTVPKNGQIIPFVLDEKGEYKSASDYTQVLDKQPRTITAFINDVDQTHEKLQLVRAIA